MTNSIENINFLRELNDKTIDYHDVTLTPNISGGTFTVKRARFTDYQISGNDFKKVLEIIQKELLLVFPQESLMGSIEGYLIIDLHAQLLLQFGTSNLPEGYSLKKLFHLCTSEQNKEILKQLMEEGILGGTIKEKFEDYCY